MVKHKQGTCPHCGWVGAVTNTLHPFAHEANGKQCPGVESKVLTGEVEEHDGKRLTSGDLLSDIEFTPPEIFEPVLRALGRKSFCFDPCSHPKALVPADTKLYYEHDGLSFDWGGEGVGFGQPPYSNPKEWIRRFAKHPGGMVCLLNGDFSTSIYEEVIWPQALFVILLYKRVKHVSPYRTGDVQAKRPSSIVAFDPERVIKWRSKALAELEAMGRMVT